MISSGTAEPGDNRTSDRFGAIRIESTEWLPVSGPPAMTLARQLAALLIHREVSSGRADRPSSLRLPSRADESRPEETRKSA